MNNGGVVFVLFSFFNVTCISSSHIKMFMIMFMEKAQGRSSHRRCSVKKGVLKKFRKIHRKTPVLGVIFKPATLLKSDSNTGVFL